MIPLIWSLKRTSVSAAGFFRLAVRPLLFYRYIVFIYICIYIMTPFISNLKRACVSAAVFVRLAVWPLLLYEAYFGRDDEVRQERPSGPGNFKRRMIMFFVLLAVRPLFFEYSRGLSLPSRNIHLHMRTNQLAAVMLDSAELTNKPVVWAGDDCVSWAGGWDDRPRRVDLGQLPNRCYGGRSEASSCTFWIALGHPLWETRCGAGSSGGRRKRARAFDATVRFYLGGKKIITNGFWQLVITYIYIFFFV